MARSKQTRNAPGTGTIYKSTKRNLWVGQIRIDGKRRSVYGNTRTEARDKLNRLLAAPPEPATAPAANASAVTVAELLNTWLTRDLAGRDVSPATLNYHRWSVELWTNTIGDRPADNLTVNDVEAALDWIMRTGRRGGDEHDVEPLSRATLRKVLSTLRQSLEFGLRRGQVTRNVARSALLPADATKTVPRNALHPDDARTLLVALRATPNGLMFGLSLLIGLRPGEAAGLYWSDVDLDAGIVNVRRNIQVDQRGAAQVVDSLKVASARRSLTMPSGLVDWFREHRGASPVVPIDGQALAFPNAAGGAIHPTTSRAELADICDAAEVPTVRPNELRHSCATLLIDQGAPIEQVADLLGHTSTRMVDVTYRHRIRPTVDTALLLDLTAEAEAQ